VYSGGADLGRRVRGSTGNPEYAHGKKNPDGIPRNEVGGKKKNKKLEETETWAGCTDRRRGWEGNDGAVEKPKRKGGQPAKELITKEDNKGSTRKKLAGPPVRVNAQNHGAKTKNFKKMRKRDLSYGAWETSEKNAARR